MNKIYEVVLKRSALKDLRRIPKSIARSIEDRFEALAQNPFPPGMEPIGGYDNYYRIRLGNYRIVYEVSTIVRIVTVVRIGHRKDVYRSL